MKVERNIFARIALIIGLIISEYINQTLCFPKRSISLPRRSYSLPHVSSSLVSSTYRKPSTFQQSYKNQRSSARSINSVPLQIGK